MAIAGCATNEPAKIRTKSETEIAVAAIKLEWLKSCEHQAVSTPDNQVGVLLQDYVDTAEAFAICMKRHNDFVGFIRPIVEKERAKPASP
jgi:hypothetical protein